jgi:hypothetical protein
LEPIKQGAEHDRKKGIIRETVIDTKRRFPGFTGNNETYLH